VQRAGSLPIPTHFPEFRLPIVSAHVVQYGLSGAMRTLVVSGNTTDPTVGRLRGVLRSKVDPHGPTVCDYAEMTQKLAQNPAEMILVVLSADPSQGLEMVRRARRLTANPVIAVGHAAEPKLILRALQDGADHYLDEAEIESGIEAVLVRLQSKEEVKAPSGRLVAVLSACGGSGASTIAVNLAAVLTCEYQRCVLLDLKPGRGDLAALLDLKPVYHLADLCRNVDRLDAAMFDKMLVSHENGIRLLASPQGFGDTCTVTERGVTSALSMARKMGAHIVVDLEDCFHKEQTIALKAATSILVAARLDFTSMRNARRILEHITSELEVPRGRIRLVINRLGQPGELPLAEAEEALGGKISHYIPDDPRTVNEANNIGIPVVTRAPKSRVARKIMELAKSVLERRRPDNHGATQPTNGKWLMNMFSR
jgi:pilus assembly protein CpaE